MLTALTQAAGPQQPGQDQLENMVCTTHLSEAKGNLIIEMWNRGEFQMAVKIFEEHLADLSLAHAEAMRCAEAAKAWIEKNGK